MTGGDDSTATAPTGPIGVGIGGSCPNCRAPVELAQEFCLQCGAPIRFTPKRRAKPGPVAKGGSGFPWKWFFVVIILLALAISGVMLSSGNSSDEKDDTTSSTIDTTEDTTAETIDTVPSTDGFADDGLSDTVLDDGIDDPAVTDPSTLDPDTTTDDGTATSDNEWPSGESGYTVVVYSLPQDSYTEDEANNRAATLQSEGLGGGVIDSNEFGSLTAGYWVVYSGRYDDEAEATSHLSEVQAGGYQGAYTRHITP